VVLEIETVDNNKNKMGQAKTPREAGLTNRNFGTTPVMLSSDTNLEEVLTGTEFTEVHEFTGSLRLANVPGGLNDEPLDIYPFISGHKFRTSKSIHIIPSSGGPGTSYHLAVSGSTMIGSDYTHQHTITGSVILKSLGNYANDAAAEADSIVIGQMYHTNGIVKIRIV
jgi:hypothetical protein